MANPEGVDVKTWGYLSGSGLNSYRFIDIDAYRTPHHGELLSERILVPNASFMTTL